MAKKDFDVILCDIKMPGVSGKELFNFIKKNKSKLVDKMVFITGDLLSEDTKKFMKKTGSSFIEKPLQIDSLIEIVQNLFKNEL